MDNTSNYINLRDCYRYCVLHILENILSFKLMEPIQLPSALDREASGILLEILYMHM